MALINIDNSFLPVLNKSSDGLYLIKGKFYRDIKSCRKGTYYVNPILKITFSSGGTYSYNPFDVTFFPFTRTVEGDFRVRDDNGRYYIAARIHIFGNNQAYGIESRKGYISYAMARNTSIESSLLAHGKPKVFDYLSVLSEISTIDTGDGDMKSLRQKYDNLKFMFKGSLLASFCNPENFMKEERHCPLMIFPFGCNESQYNAVRNALENRLSIIQGPPGTGKTQTILNIVANLLLYNKTCLIVSNNNSAVSNVVEKLSNPRYGLDFLVASLGKLENKERFIHNQKTLWPDMSSWKISSSRESKLKSEIKRVETGLQSYFNSQEELSVLLELESEHRYQASLAGISMPKRRRRKLFSCSISSLYKILLQYDSEMQRQGKPSWKTRLKAYFYGLDISDRSTIEKSIQNKEYEQTLSSISSLKKTITEFENSYNRYQEISLELLKSHLAYRFGRTSIRRIYSRKEIELTHSQDFLFDYPIVTSTTFSATANIYNLIPYDYLIMDEASQVDIAAGALALNCARSAVIVGDPKQLPNVVVEKDAKLGLLLFGGIFVCNRPFRSAGTFTDYSSALKIINLDNRAIHIK